jgi:serine/threonine protein kinase/Tol biopolymer transport system component
MQAERWKQVEALFEAAQHLPSDQRAAFLQQARPGDPELCAEVESLLKAADSRDPLLDGSPLSSITGRPPALKPGDKLGNFEIVALIGRGGMGEVYRARDPRLKRDVAIKTLPPGFADDRDRIARFEREARAASALNHPNIVSVFDIGTEGGVSFIVSELVDGETLAQLIKRGPLPLRKLIEVSTQICDGLAAAHTAGVIHRDLKPGNIMLTRDGRVKILDFGLAHRDRPPGLDNTTTQASHPGMILGTPGYMSPEQVRGESTDARSDLFSLGVILYEMACGKRAFSGTSSVEVMNSILKDDPPGLPPASPPALDRIIRRCIEKQPARRFQSAADLGFAIKSLAGLSSTPSVEKTTRRTGGLAWGAGIVASLAIILAAFLWLNRPLPQPQVTAMVQITNDGRSNGAPLLTDGTRLFFNIVAGNPAGSGCLQLAAKGGETAPFSLPMRDVILQDISPDRTDFLAYREITYDGNLSNGELWVLPVSGGAPRRLGNLIATQRRYLVGGIGFPTPRRLGLADGHQSAIAWSPDGQQLVYPRENELHLARSDGTEVRKLATLNGFPFFVRWSPDGRRLRVSVSKDGDTTATLWEVSVDDGHARRLFPDWNPAWYTCCGNWTADGKYYVFQSRANIWATRDNRGFFERIGSEPVQLTRGPMAAYWPLPSADGKRIFFAGYQLRKEFVRYDLESGRSAPELRGVSGDFLEYSRDGKRVAYVSVPGGALFSAAADGSQRLQLTSPPLEAALPRWSPDGKQIAFAGRSANGPWRVYVVTIEGSGLRQVTTGESGKQGDIDPSWSPDGASLAFGAFIGDSPGQEFIRVVELKTGRVSVLPGSQGMWSPRWSPNGRVIAGLSEALTLYPTKGSDKLMVYDVQTRKQSQLFDQPSNCPSWSWDGESLLFSAQDSGWCFRVRMGSRKVERVTNLNELHAASWWFAAAPNSSFITTVDAGTEEIFALDWKAP